MTRLPSAAAASKAAAMRAVAAGDRSLALEHMRRAVALAPESAALQVELGCLLAMDGQLPPAIDRFVDATRLDPAFAS